MGKSTVKFIDKEFRPVGVQWKSRPGLITLTMKYLFLTFELQK